MARILELNDVLEPILGRVCSNECNDCHVLCCSMACKCFASTICRILRAVQAETDKVQGSPLFSTSTSGIVQSKERYNWIKTFPLCQQPQWMRQLPSWRDGVQETGVQKTGVQYPEPWCRACEMAAQGGNLEMVRWAMGMMVAKWGWLYLPQPRVCVAAAKGGHLHVLQYAVSHKWTFRIVECATAAASGGHVGVVDWIWDEIHQTNCVNKLFVLEEIVKVAFSNGRRNILEWAMESAFHPSGRGTTTLTNSMAPSLKSFAIMLVCGIVQRLELKETATPDGVEIFTWLQGKKKSVEDLEEMNH